VQNARQEQALASYEQTVLRSMQDVENALIAYDREQARRVNLSAAVDANKRAVDLSNQLYTRGLIDFLSVLDGARCSYLRTSWRSAIRR
jgi:outer membrane protein TolC